MDPATITAVAKAAATALTDEELTNAQNIIEMQAASIKELQEKLDAIQQILEGKKPIIKPEKPYHSV